MGVLDKNMSYDECANFLGILETGLSDFFKKDEEGADNIIMLKIKAALSMAKIMMIQKAIEEAEKKIGGDNK